MNKRKAKKQKTETYKRLTKEYNKLYRKADDRLKALEQLASNPDYESVLQWAYAKAMKDIKVWGGVNRFGSKKPQNTQSLKAKINDIKSFLDMPTSLKSQIVKIYKKRANKLNANWGTNFRWEEIGEFFESKSYHKYEEKYGSDTILKAFAVIQENDLKVLKDIQRLGEDKIKLPNPKIREAVEDLLKDRHKDLKNFKGKNRERGQNN